MIGLSKIPRLVDVFARRLQIQERMTNQIAETIREKIDPRGVAVVCEGDAPVHVDARRREAELVCGDQRDARRRSATTRARAWSSSSCCAAVPRPWPGLPANVPARVHQ